MPREYARTRISAFDDPDLEELTCEAQFLYFRLLLPHPLLSAAGVAPWRPKHLVRKASNMTLGKMLAAAAELEQANMILIDLDTDEVLVRSYVRGDELLRNPKMAGAMIKAWQSIGSRVLQAALVTELVRVRRESPEYSSWVYKDTAAPLARILSRPDLKAVGYRFAYPTTVPVEAPIADPDPVSIGNRDAMPIGNPDPVENANSVPGADYPRDSVEIPCTYTHTRNLHHDGGYVTGVPHVADAADPPPTPTPQPDTDPEPPVPSPRCQRHQYGPDTPCRDCRDARLAAERRKADATRTETSQRSAQVRAAAESRVRRADACDLCTDGYRPDGRVCDHDPDTDDRRRRGLEQCRAELAQKSSNVVDFGSVRAGRRRVS